MKILNKLLFMAAAVGLVAGCAENKGDEAPQEHTVTVTTDGNGTAVATVNGKAAAKAEASATVTLTATPKEGFVFSKWSVVSGGAELADATLATTTFKMPAKAVSVKAEFVAETVPTYAVKVTTDNNGTAVAKIGDATVAEAEEGQEVTLSATPKEGYLFSQWIVSAGGVKLADAGKAETTFTMPAAEVAVKAEFTEKEAPKYKIEVIAGEHGSAVAKARGEEVTEAVESMNINIIATPDEGYVFSKWIAEGVELIASTSPDIVFPMPANDVKITAEFVVKTYAFTVEEPRNGTVTATVDGSPAAEALAEGVTVSLKAAANENYIFSQWVATGVTLDSPTAAEISFTMPAGDVSVKAEFLHKSAIKRAVTVTNDGNGTATATIGGAVVSEAVEGTTVTITATPDDGFEFSEWEVLSGRVTIADATASSTVFVMPSEEVSIKAKFVVKTYAITAATDGNGTAAATVDGQAAEKAAAGAEVTLTATPSDEYLFSKWVVVSGNGVTFADASSATTTFTMPAGAVSVKAEFTVKTYAITMNAENGTAAAKIGEAAAAEAAKGQSVAITATASSGYVFSKWVVEGGDASIADVNSASTTFTMPAGAVTIKAEFALTYAITLNNDGNGSAVATVGGGAVTAAAEGQEVTIAATANAGYAFSKWVVESGGAVLADASAASTTFTMPAEAVSIKAEFYAPDPSITYNNDADLWLNTASFALDYIPAGANVSVSYKRAGDADWQTAAVNGNTATIAPVWEDKTEADWFTHYAAGDVSPYSRIKKGTGVFAANTYDYKLTVNGSDFTGQFTTASGDVIPNGDMKEWNDNSPNASGLSFWGNGNNSMASKLCVSATDKFGKEAPSAKMASTKALLGIMAAGNLFTGSFSLKVTTGTVKFGQQYDYTARPSAMKVKYHAKVGTVDKARSDAPLKSGDQDRARIYVVIMDWNKPHEVASSPNSTTGGWDPEKCAGATAEGKVIGYGSLWIPASTSGDAMVDAEIPMQWFDKTAKPASGNYSIIISCACNAFGDYFTGCTSNVLYVDDFEWAY